MYNLNMEQFVGLLEKRRLLLPSLQMRHHKHHFSLTPQQQKPQRLQQRLIQMVVIHHVGSQYHIELSAHAFHLLCVPPRQGGHAHRPAAALHDSRIRVRVELQVGEHVGEVRDRDASTKQCSCRDPYHSSAGPQLQDAEAAAVIGDQAGEGRGLSVAVEEGHEGVGGGPELEGEALGGDLADDDAGVDGVEKVALLGRRRRRLFWFLVRLSVILVLL